MVRRLMKLAVRESDINFIKYLIEEKSVDVNGEHQSINLNFH